ncbi:MAG: hypothetical protein Q9204_005001 [Flavoplaca sp. TL-2023a]
MLLRTALSTILFLASLAAGLMVNPKEGKKNISATDILACPSQPAAIDILCGGEGSSDTNGPMKRCYPRGAQHCDPSEVHESQVMHCPYYTRNFHAIGNEFLRLIPLIHRLIGIITTDSFITRLLIHIQSSIFLKASRAMISLQNNPIIDL